jgi:hypothetical protein
MIALQLQSPSNLFPLPPSFYCSDEYTVQTIKLQKLNLQPKKMDPTFYPQQRQSGAKRFMNKLKFKRAGGIGISFFFFSPFSFPFSFFFSFSFLSLYLIIFNGLFSTCVCY